MSDEQNTRERFEEFMQGLAKHNSEDLEFAVMITGHNKGNNLQVRTLLCGPVLHVATAINDLMAEVIKYEPRTAPFFLKKLLERVGTEKLPQPKNTH